MAMLMLCDTPVYDIANDVVLNKMLCPFVSADSTRKAYGVWRKHRSYLKTNRTAEQSRQVHAEMLAVKLAHQSGLKAMNAFVRTEQGKIYAKAYPITFDYSSLGLVNLVNITSTKRSMIQFDQLGIGVNGYNIMNVAKAYAKAGVKEDVTNITLTQILFDCVVGNVDRRNNNSNWAIFLDNESGKRTPSWMYDFNWANFSTEPTDMIEEVSSYIREAKLCDVAQALLVPIHNACESLNLALWNENAKVLKAKNS